MVPLLNWTGISILLVQLSFTCIIILFSQQEKKAQWCNFDLTNEVQLYPPPQKKNLMQEQN